MELQFVHGCISDMQRSKLIDFWVTQKAIQDPRECLRRSSEAVFLVLNSGGDIDGVCTLGERPDGLHFRTFVQPQAIASATLGIRMLSATRDHLKEQGEYRPLVVELHNPKLQQSAGMAHALEKEGFIKVPNMYSSYPRWEYRFIGQ